MSKNEIEMDVAKRIWDITRISPDYGNAVMDVIGYSTYCDIAKLISSCEKNEKKES